MDEIGVCYYRHVYFVCGGQRDVHILAKQGNSSVVDSSTSHLQVHNMRTLVTVCMLLRIHMVHTRIFARQLILPLLKKLKALIHVQQYLLVCQTISFV